MTLSPVDNIGEAGLQPGPGCLPEIWRIPQCPFSIECPPALLEQIRIEVQCARNFPRGKRETGGVLFGVPEPDRVRILACRPIDCEHAIGSGFVLSEKDQQRLAQLISAPATGLELAGLQVVGWYHSHIRSGIFLSELDRQIHARHFGAPYQIALVIHPSSDGPVRAGFFFREESGNMRTEACYQEFTIDAPAMERAVRPDAPSEKARPRRPASEGPAAKPQSQTTCPRCGSRQVRRSRRTGPFERLCGLFGFYPYRCYECLSRSFVKTAELLERTPHSRKRPEESRRARVRTRREVLLWGGGLIGFLAILAYLIRDTGSGPDQP